MNPGGETETALNRNRIAQADPLEARANDENILRRFIQAQNTLPESAPPLPKRKPERKDEIRLKAEDQGEFVGDLFANLVTGRLKKMPIKNPVIRKALSKALKVSEGVISTIPEKLWTSIAEKQMRERQENKNNAKPQQD